MNKIIISLFSSLFLLFFIWCIVLFARYGTNFLNYRIDFGATFNKLSVNSDWAYAINQFNTSFTSLRLRLLSADSYFVDFLTNKLDMNWFFLIILNAINYIVKGIYFLWSFVFFFVDIVKSIAVWFAYSVWILIQLIGFLFNPVVINV